MIFLPFMMPFYGIAGGAGRERTSLHGATVLAVVAIAGTATVSVASCYFLGLRGLLVVPGLAVLLAWVFAWGWLACACLDLSLDHRGTTAGVYALGGAFSLAIGLFSLVVALSMFAIKVVGL